VKIITDQITLYEGENPNYPGLKQDHGIHAFCFWTFTEMEDFCKNDFIGFDHINKAKTDNSLVKFWGVTKEMIYAS